MDGDNEKLRTTERVFLSPARCSFSDFPTSTVCVVYRFLINIDYCSVMWQNSKKECALKTDCVPQYKRHFDKGCGIIVGDLKLFFHMNGRVKTKYYY